MRGSLADFAILLFGFVLGWGAHVMILWLWELALTLWASRPRKGTFKNTRWFG